MGVFIILPAALQAQNLREYVAIDSLEVGDTFYYSITLDRDQQYDDIQFPDSTAFGSVFEIRSRRQFKTSTYKDSVAYELSIFWHIRYNHPPAAGAPCSTAGYHGAIHKPRSRQFQQRTGRG
ncbi:MAG: hypothetical protein U5J63_10615 [Fodinibius sp.]|nr:hypothetical protein [Fodinibius sp.]